MEKIVEDRQKLWDTYEGNKEPFIRHMWLDYDRYHEARLIGNWLEVNEPHFASLTVLDYGCGVGDYGFHLHRQGVYSVDFYDVTTVIEFVQYRIRKARIKRTSTINADTSAVGMAKYDVVVFGEVLEHLHDPLGVIKKATDAGVSYILTSSYPYRSDDPNEGYWQHHGHSDDARLVQPACRALLEALYEYQKFDGELRLWKRK